MKKEKIKIGVIGIGYLGRFHLEKFQKNKHCKVTWIIDTNPQSLEEFEGRYSKGNDYKKIVDDIDAVSIVTPTMNHYQISKYFLSNDKHVLIEKPMTEKVSEATTLIKLAKKKKKIIQIGHLERFNPVIKKLSTLIKNPLFIEVHRLSKFNPRSTDINVIYDLMIHDIDIIMSLIPSKIKNISAFGKKIITNKTDIANARLEFHNGSIINLTASRISQKNERKMRLFEKDKYFSIDFLTSNIKIIEKNKNNSNKLFNTIEYNYKKSDALKNEIMNFILCIKDNKKPLVDGVQGREALKIATSISKRL